MRWVWMNISWMLRIRFHLVKDWPGCNLLWTLSASLVRLEQDRPRDWIWPQFQSCFKRRTRSFAKERRKSKLLQTPKMQRTLCWFQLLHQSLCCWRYHLDLDLDQDLYIYIFKTGWRLWPPTRAIFPERGSRLSKPIHRTHIAQPCLWRPRNHKNYTLGFLFF